MNNNNFDVLNKLSPDGAKLFEDMFGDLFRKTNHFDNEYEYTVKKGQDMSTVTMDNAFKKKKKDMK
jgi:hypothetical protein